MEPMELVKDLDLAALFAAGAASALRGTEATEKQAEDFVFGVCKEAAAGRADYDDDDDTFWSRNKGWLLPAIVGALAFKIGGDAGSGRPDKSYFSNAFGQLKDRLYGFLGYPKGPMTNALSLPDPKTAQRARRASGAWNPPKPAVLSYDEPQGRGDLI